jgi:DNA-binding transcriptional MerR regulator
MEQNGKAYTVNQLARLARVSVRTLHHYDQIGLLEPSERTASGYRLYRKPELLRLQQILFYKELDIPLMTIKEILGRPGFDQVEALLEHRRNLQQRASRIEKLLQTIDKTITKITEEKMELTDAELYDGFTEEQRERYPRQAKERYGTEMVEETEKRLRKLSKAEWQSIKEEGDQVTRDLAALADRPPQDAQVQAAIARHHAWIEHFFDAPADVYRRLGQGYAEDPDFRSTYDKYRTGLADFIRAAIDYYCYNTLRD